MPFLLIPIIFLLAYWILSRKKSVAGSYYTCQWCKKISKTNQEFCKRCKKNDHGLTEIQQIRKDLALILEKNDNKAIIKEDEISMQRLKAKVDLLSDEVHFISETLRLNSKRVDVMQRHMNSISEQSNLIKDMIAGEIRKNNMNKK